MGISIAIIFVIGLCLVVPIGLLIITYLWLERRGHKKIGLSIVFSAITSLGYLIYLAIRPPDSFVELLIAIIIVVGFLLAILIGLLYILYRWFNRKGYKKIGLSISFLILCGLGYVIYTAIYPTNSYYKDQFEYNTKLKFPSSGKIIAKDASYPDLHGKYESVARIIFSKADYKTLLLKVDSDSTFKSDTVMGHYNDYFKKVATGIYKRDFIKIVVKGELTIGFLNDSQTVITEHDIF